MLERARGHELCGDCGRRIAADQSAATAEYTTALATIDPTSPLQGLSTRLAELETRAGLEPAVKAEARLGVLRNLMARYVADASLTEEEEDSLSAVAQALSLDTFALGRAMVGRESEVLIAKLNAGRLEPMSSPQLMTKRGEAVYLQVRAELLKEVVHREMRGGYAGVSFRVAKGVRVNTGGFRGHSVVTGTSIVTDDAGILSITSQRIVFAGSRRGIDVPYGKILSMNGFSDGIQFLIANRVNQPTFRIVGMAHGGPVVMAYVNAIAQA
jgi:hypothetical protein